MDKRCTKCGEVKGLEEFSREPGGRDRLKGACRDCCKALTRAWAKANPDKVAAKNRAWSKANREKIATKNFRANLLIYELTPDSYNVLLEAQEGVCAGCGKAPNGKRLCVDHDHACCPAGGSCGKCIRGLLCDTCNNILGRINESVEILETLVYYLRSWETRDRINPAPTG